MDLKKEKAEISSVVCDKQEISKNIILKYKISMAKRRLVQALQIMATV